MNPIYEFYVFYFTILWNWFESAESVSPLIRCGHAVYTAAHKQRYFTILHHTHRLSVNLLRRHTQRCALRMLLGFLGARNSRFFRNDQRFVRSEKRQFFRNPDFFESDRGATHWNRHVDKAGSSPNVWGLRMRVRSRVNELKSICLVLSHTFGYLEQKLLGRLWKS
jgi:hypothetical protein